MDNHPFLQTLHTAWSAAQLEQLKGFLHTTSQIPSRNSIQEALQPQSPHQSQHSNQSVTRYENAPSLVTNRPVPDGVTRMKYPEPDLKSMVFDPGTGYRYDSSTGLYYDANSGLFLNKQSNILLSWNPIINSYSLVETDSAHPVLQKARLMEQLQTSTSSVAQSLGRDQKPVTKSPFPSVLSHSIDWDFGEMSPDQGEDPSIQRKYDPTDCCSSSSFEEMTPEREHGASTYPGMKDPCGSARAYRSPERKRPSPNRGAKSRSRLSSKRCSRSPERSFNSDNRDSRRTAPPRDYPGSSSEAPSRGRYRSDTRAFSPEEKSKLRLSPERCRSRSRDSRTRGSNQSRRSPCSSTPRRNRPSPSSERIQSRTSPRRTSSRRSSPERRSGRLLSPTECSSRRRKQFGSGLRDYHTGRGPRPRESRRSRSQSRSRRQSRLRGQSKIDRNLVNSRSHHSRDSRSPSAASSKRRASSNVAKKVQASTSHDGPTKRNTESAKTARKPPDGKTLAELSCSVKKIHKSNMMDPANPLGQIFPDSMKTAFLLLSPLPPKGDREWKDLEILFTRMLTAEGVDFVSVAVLPGDGGAPCNYALIRFKTNEDASRWYVKHEGAIDLGGPDGTTRRVFMNFIQNNWKCRKCQTNNFSLRNFCYKCFWYKNQNQPNQIAKSPIKVSQLVTKWVGISGLDCRFWSIDEVMKGLPPLDSFNIETYELLVEHTGIPVGLCVFQFRTSHESAAFFTYLQESCANPLFIDIVRVGLDTKPVLGHLLKSAVGGEQAALPSREKDGVVFQNPPTADPENDPLLWWRDVSGYVPEEGLHLMLRYLFESHPLTHLVFNSAPAQIFIGPLPVPQDCNLIDFRDLFSRFLQSVGVSPKTTEKTAIFVAHRFGAPFHYSVLRFEFKDAAKVWYDAYDGKLVMDLENGSKWPLYIHFTKPNWSCDDCHKLNFPLRVQCFFCYKSRSSDHTTVTVKKTPTGRVGITGFRNWCATEELLMKRLPFLKDVKGLDVSYLKEPTGVPLGICVLKTPTPSGSAILYNKMQDALSNEIARINIEEPNRPLLVHIL